MAKVKAARLALIPKLPTAKRQLMLGNEAICEGAIAAGVRFYAGYPITPCTEIAEAMSRRMPQVGGTYVQMEDELASGDACMGASITGTKSMTATAGPGISLMQDCIGMAVSGEIPFVMVNVQRDGPGLGNATRSGQGDFMQARWGPHGDRPAVVLAPSTVEEAFWVTAQAVNLSEQLRTVVIVLAEGLLGLMREVVALPDYNQVPKADRPRPTCSPEEYDPYRVESMEDVPPLADAGSGYRNIYHVSPSLGSLERPGGVREKLKLDMFSAQTFAKQRLFAKIEARHQQLTFTESYATEDAEVLLAAFGTQARTARYVAEQARRRGQRVGSLKLITVWPFPEEEIRAAAANVKAIIVPEMNMGQLRQEIERVLRRHPAEVYGVNHLDTTAVQPREIEAKIAEVLR